MPSRLHIALLCCQPHDLTVQWAADGLTALGHDVEVVHRPDLPLTAAGSLGYDVADGWTDAPDAVLALDPVAGLAATVATRERPAPLLVRLPRPGRSGDPATTRVERAVARGARAVLAASPRELDDLVRLGIARPRLHVVPEAVDAGPLRPAQVPDDPEPVAATDDDAGSVHTVLRAMAAGRPAVVADVGGLPDLVADEVSGVVVPGADAVRHALLALAADQVRRASMGMAAADRVAACFDTAVVVPALGRVLETALRGALTPA
jgi:hypothetical protein